MNLSRRAGMVLSRSDMADALPTQQAELKAPELSNRLVLPTLQYFEEIMGSDRLAAVVEEAGLPREYLEDATGWVSMDYLERFTAAVVRQLGHQGQNLPAYDDPVWRHWHELGRRSLQRDALGPAFVALQAMGSPGALLSRFGAVAGRGNRAVQFEGRLLGQGLAEMCCAPRDGGRGWYVPSCWNFRAILETVPTIWGLPPARVDHPRCMFSKHNPSTSCVYVVRYGNSRMVQARTTGLVGLVGASIGFGITYLLGAGALSWLGGLCGVGLAFSVYFARRSLGAEARIAADGIQLGSVIDDLDQRYAELYEEGRELRRTLMASQKLSGYLPSDLVDRIIANPSDELELGGERTQAAVLFADLVGFTSRCERMDPEDLVADLNCYFRHIDPAFGRHGGVIDKRMGDGVMAVFVPRGDAGPKEIRRRAVRCAVDLLAGLRAANRELRSRGAELLQVRVGIAAGPLVQGKMGSSAKFEYTVVGDVVNVAARLESQASPGHVLVTSDVWNAFQGEPPDTIRPVGRQIISVKGKQQMIDVVELGVTDDSHE